MVNYMQTRQSKILNVLSQSQRVTVSELSNILNVSEVTIRKDLSQLEDKGLLKREHGYAAIVNSDDVINRLSFNYDLKKRIAQKAVESIKDSETIMIESGSCCALLAEEVASIRRDVTIITNSVFIATFIRHLAAKLILLGGEYQTESQVMVGPLIKVSVENFYVDKLFIGVDGFNKVGATAGDLMRAEAVRDMSKHARKVIILTESKKFEQVGVVPLLKYEHLHKIYTDNQNDASNIPKNVEIIHCLTEDSK